MNILAKSYLITYYISLSFLFHVVESECDVDMCQNNGTCVQHARSITCNCPEGFIGIFCQEIGRQENFFP